MPVLADGALTMSLTDVNMISVGLTPFGKREVAPGVGAARHLKIDHAVDEIVALDQLFLDFLDACDAFGQLQRNLADRPLQPRQMRGVVDQLAVEHGGHFVDAVGKQETTVEHRDLGLRQRHERPVDVSDLFQAKSPVGGASGFGAQYTQIVKPMNPPTVIPGMVRRTSTRNLRFRVRIFAAPRNDVQASNATGSSTETSARGRCGACRRSRPFSHPRRSRRGP